MTNEIIATYSYDYSQLPEADRLFVQDATSVIRQVRRQAIVEIGKQLTEIKARLPHGQWLPWLEAEFPYWAERTAQEYMRVYSAFTAGPQQDRRAAQTRHSGERNEKPVPLSGEATGLAGLSRAVHPAAEFFELGGPGRAM